MAGAAGFPSFSIPLQALKPNIAELFGAATFLPGRVVGDAQQGLAALVSGARIPLPDGVDIVPGERVLVRLTREGGEPRIVVGRAPTATTTAATSNSAIPPGVSSDPIARLLPQVLRGFPAAERLVAALLKGDVPLEEAVAAVRAAVEKLPPEVRTALPPSVRAQGSDDAIARLIQRWVGLQRSTPEAALARTISQGADDFPVEDVLLLASLRRAIGGKGAGGAENMGERFFEQVTGSRLWNAHGVEQPYVYAEIPVRPEGFWRRAQLHVFGDGANDTGTFRGAVSVVLDLDTVRLGRVVARLRINAKGACECHMEIENTEAVPRFQSAAADLQEAIVRAGYAAARVDVVELSNAAEALLPPDVATRLSGVNLEA